MKVALLMTPEIVIHKPEYVGGTERVFFQDAEVLKKSGHVVELYGRAIDNNGVKKLLTQQRNIQALPKLVRLGLEFWYCFLFLVPARYNHIYLTYSFPLLGLLAPRKTVVMLHSLPEYLPRWLYIPFAHRLHIICCSQFLKKQLLCVYPWLSVAQISVMHNAVNTQQFKPLHSVTNKQNRAKKNKKEQPKIRLLFASAWVKEKGLHIFLQALAYLPKVYQQKIEVAIASDKNLWYIADNNSHQRYVNQVLNQLKKLPYIKLLGGIPHDLMPVVYAEYDYLIFPSVWDEPFGLVILEALACGTKVVAFDRGAVNEIVSATNSILISQERVEALAKVLKQIIGDTKNQTETIGDRPQRRSLLTIKNRQMKLVNRKKELLKYLNSFYHEIRIH